MRLIDADRLLEVYDQIHIGPPGNARIMIATAPTVERPGWVSVKDRLPEEKGEYIVSDGETVFGAYYEINAFGTRWTDATEGYYEYKVTHWMPMPEPPEGVSGNA